MLALRDSYQRFQSGVKQSEDIEKNSSLGRGSASSIDDTVGELFDVKSRTSMSTSITSCQDNGMGSPMAAGSSKMKSSTPVSKKRRSVSYSGAIGTDYIESDVLQSLDPYPAYCPSYRSVNPNTRIRYPIFERPEDHVLPEYSPAVHEVAVVSIKMEWLSPYEPAGSRGWKECLMEINSTQLNFYQISEALVRDVKTNGGDCSSKCSDVQSTGSFSSLGRYGNIFSLHTPKDGSGFTRKDQEYISSRVKGEPGRYLAEDLLFKSYSLQYATFGMPTDYTKKPYVLRMRCEMNQFLVSFLHVDDMINWNVHLSIGIGVSLDLDQRELPTYRTVPRRRRMRRRRRKHNRARANRGNMPELASSSGIISFGTAFDRQSLSEYDRQERRSFPNMHTGSSSLFSQRGLIDVQAYECEARSAYLNRSSEPSLSNRITSRLRKLFISDKRSRLNDSKSTAGSRIRGRNISLGSLIEDQNEDLYDIPPTPGSSQPVVIRERVINKASASRSKPSQVDAPGDKNLPTKNANSGTDALLEPTVSAESSTAFSMSLNYSQSSDSTTATAPKVDPSCTLPRPNGSSSRTRQARKQPNVEGGIVPIVDGEYPEDGLDMETSSEEGASSSSCRQNSIYIDEGIYPESDDDLSSGSFNSSRHNSLSMFDYRWRTGSICSNLSQIYYGVNQSESKWHPPRKEISRRRYTYDSLRCIKTLCEDDEWLGAIVVQPDKNTNHENASNHFNKMVYPLRKKYNKYGKNDSSGITRANQKQMGAYLVGPVCLIKLDPVITEQINTLSRITSRCFLT